MREENEAAIEAVELALELSDSSAVVLARQAHVLVADTNEE